MYPRSSLFSGDFMRKVLFLLLLFFVPVGSAATNLPWAFNGYSEFSEDNMSTVDTLVFGDSVNYSHFIIDYNCWNGPPNSGTIIMTIMNTFQSNPIAGRSYTIPYNYVWEDDTSLPGTTASSIDVFSDCVDYGINANFTWTQNASLESESYTNTMVYMNISFTPEANISYGEVEATYSIINFTLNGYVGATTVLLDDVDVSANASRSAETVTVNFTDMNTSAHWINISTVYNKEPTLSAPADDSVHNYSYPPMTHLINLSSEDVCAYTRYKVWQGNVLKYSTLVAGNSTGVYLPSGTYMWSAESYSPELGTYSTYDTRNFTINDLLSHPINATGVYGVIYEDLAGMDTAVESALVTVYNASWSDELITDEYGYYEFYNLTNDTYYIAVSKDRYDTPAVKYITLTTNNMSLMNIYIERNTGDYYARHDVEFIVKSLLGTRYENVEATVYIDGSSNIYDVSETDVRGSVVFPLEEDTEYRITFINVTQGISRDITLFPLDDQYNIYVFSNTLFTTDEVEIDEIEINATTEEINSTAAYINVTYHDEMDETLSLNISLYQTNLSDPVNMTLIDSAVCGVTSDHTESFIVTGYAGRAYQIEVEATHTTFGDVDKTFAVKFIDDVVEDFEHFKTYLAAFLLVFVSMMFKKSNVEQGALVVCGLAWLFAGLGMWGSYWGFSMTGLLSLATVTAVAANMHKKEQVNV